jgi:hypothetical protein
MLYYLAAFFEIIAFLIFLVVYKKNRDTLLKYLGLFLLFDIVTDIISFLGFNYLNVNTIIVSNFDLIVQLFFISYILYKLIPQKNKKILKTVLCFSSAIIGFFIIYVYFFLPSNFEWNYRVRVLAGVYLVILACYYLYWEFISDELHIPLRKRTGFWLASSILIYQSGCSIVIALHHFTTENKALLIGMPLHHFFSAVLAIFSSVFQSIAILVWPKSSSRV